MENLQSQPDIGHCWDAGFAKDLRAAKPLIKRLFEIERKFSAMEAAEFTGIPPNAHPLLCGCTGNCGPIRGTDTETGVGMTSLNRANTVYFDFARKRVLVGDDDRPIGDNQPDRLVELAIRYGMFNFADAFLSFDEWRLTKKQFDPKRRLQVVISKANKLIRPYGLGFVSSETAESTYVMTGWMDTGHKSNIGEAMFKLRKAFEAMKKREINCEGALTIALEAFKLDPESLPCTFFIVECLRKLKKTQVPADLLRSVNRLLRRRENIYEDAIAAIERCYAKRAADISGKLSGYKSTLDRIRRSRQLAQTLTQWREVCEEEDTRIDNIVRHIRAIQRKDKGGHYANQTNHLQTLLNSNEIQVAKRTVISKTMKLCPRHWHDDQSLQVEFDTCFAELILKKVDCAKLQHPGSFACYVKMTIPSMLLDRAFQDVYELSYSQFKAIQRLRKVRQAIRQRFGHDPSDQEVAQELRVQMRRLHLIKQWEQRLTTFRLDEDRDAGKLDEDAFPLY